MSYAEGHGVAQDEYGNAIAGATVSIVGVSTGTLATLYKDPSGANAQSNPVVSDDYGRWQAFAAAGRYNLIVTGAGNVYTIPNVEFQSVIDHSTITPIDHPDGSITADKLAFDIDEEQEAVAVHAARTTGIHGVGANYICASKVPTSTSPTFDDLTVDGSFRPVNFGDGIWCVFDADDLTNAVANAAANDAIWLLTDEINLPATLTLSTALNFFGFGNCLLDGGGLATVCVQVNSGCTFDGVMFSGNTSANDMITIAANGVKFTNCVFTTTRQDLVSMNSTSAYDVTFDRCSFVSAWWSGIHVQNVHGTYGKVRILNSKFSECDTASPGTYGQVRLNNPASAYDGGHVIENCLFDSGGGYFAIVEAPNCYLRSNHSICNPGVVYLSVAATATSTHSINNTYWTGGAAATVFDPAGNIVGAAGSTFDYVSAITEFDPTAYAEQETAQVMSVTHSLGTKLLEHVILCSDTPDFSGKVWPVTHCSSALDGDSDFVQLIFSDNNTAKLFCRLHKIRSGSDLISGKYTQRIINPANPGDWYGADGIDWLGPGGFAYVTTYWRLALRVIQSA